MESVSPELALVDPRLRSAALTALPAPGDCLVLRPRALAPPVTPGETVASVRVDRGRGGRVVSVAAVTVTGLFLLSPFLAFVPQSARSAPTLEPALSTTLEPRATGGRSELPPSRHLSEVSSPAPDPTPLPALPPPPRAPAPSSSELPSPTVVVPPQGVTRSSPISG